MASTMSEDDLETLVQLVTVHGPDAVRGFAIDRQDKSIRSRLHEGSIVEWPDEHEKTAFLMRELGRLEHSTIDDCVYIMAGCTKLVPPTGAPPEPTEIIRRFRGIIEDRTGDEINGGGTIIRNMFHGLLPLARAELKNDMLERFNGVGVDESDTIRKYWQDLFGGGEACQMKATGVTTAGI
jgi:hypothetical protein